MIFTPDGSTLLSGTAEFLKVWKWEPNRCCDTVDVSWSKLADLSMHEGKLLGGSIHNSFVGIWVVDLTRVEPFHSGSERGPGGGGSREVPERSGTAPVLLTGERGGGGGGGGGGGSTHGGIVATPGGGAFGVVGGGGRCGGGGGGGGEVSAGVVATSASARAVVRDTVSRSGGPRTAATGGRYCNSHGNGGLGSDGISLAGGGPLSAARPIRSSGGRGDGGSVSSSLFDPAHIAREDHADRAPPSMNVGFAVAHGIDSDPLHPSPSPPPVAAVAPSPPPLSQSQSPPRFFTAEQVSSHSPAARTGAGSNDGSGEYGDDYDDYNDGGDGDGGDVGGGGSDDDGGNAAVDEELPHGASAEISAAATAAGVGAMAGALGSRAEAGVEGSHWTALSSSSPRSQLVEGEVTREGAETENGMSSHQHCHESLRAEQHPPPTAVATATTSPALAAPSRPQSSRGRFITPATAGSSTGNFVDVGTGMSGTLTRGAFDLNVLRSAALEAETEFINPADAQDEDREETLAGAMARARADREREARVEGNWGGPGAAAGALAAAATTRQPAPQPVTPVGAMGLDFAAFVPGAAAAAAAAEAPDEAAVLARLGGADGGVVSGILTARLTSLRVTNMFWTRGDIRGVADALRKSGDPSVVVDVITSVLQAPQVAGGGGGGGNGPRMGGGGGGDTLTLELAAALLPLTVPLLQSPHGRYVDAALRFSRKVIGSFMPLLQQAPDAHEALARGGIGVDLVGEERAARAGVTRAALLGLKSQLLALTAGGGELAPRARELAGLIDQL